MNFADIRVFAVRIRSGQTRSVYDRAFSISPAVLGVCAVFIAQCLTDPVDIRASAQLRADRLIRACPRWVVWSLCLLAGFDFRRFFRLSISRRALARRIEKKAREKEREPPQTVYVPHEPEAQFV